MTATTPPAPKRRLALHRTGVVLVAVTGLVALATGVWFIFTDQPFDSAGYSEELQMSREEAAQASPAMESWVRHVQNQVGSVSAGWGLFVAGLALTGLRRGDPMIRNVLWVAALPTLLYSSLHEFLEFGTIDTGTLLSLLALSVFVVGMGLTYVGTPRTDDAPGPEPKPVSVT